MYTAYPKSTLARNKLTRVLIGIYIFFTITFFIIILVYIVGKDGKKRASEALNDDIPHK